MMICKRAHTCTYYHGRNWGGKSCPHKVPHEYGHSCSFEHCGEYGTDSACIPAQSMLDYVLGVELNA
jgi:hypothetical protein